MIQLMTIREYVKSFVSRYESYCKPLFKFILTILVLSVINGNIGYASVLKNFAIVLIAALLTSFLPLNFIPIIALLFVYLHLYSLSLEVVGVVAIISVLMFLIYFRFSPKDTVLLVLTPICFVFKMPYIMPIIAGLVAPTSAVVSIGCGIVMYYMLSFISQNADVIRAMGDEERLEKVRIVIEGIITNKEMMVLVAAFAITVIVVSVIRRLPVDHAWRIAVIAGTLSDIVVILAGDLKLGTYISVGGLLFGSFIGVLISLVIQFFLFDLDYSRTEKVQFEDEEYYYFVKAVPKNHIEINNYYEDDDDEDEDDDEDIRPAKRKSSSEGTSKSASSRSGSTATKSGAKSSGNSGSTGRTGKTSDADRNADRNADRKKKKEYLPDDYVPEYKVKRSSDDLYASTRAEMSHMTGIEKAAAAKARENRQKQLNK